MFAELARDEGLWTGFSRKWLRGSLKELNAKFGSLQDTVHLMEVEYQGSTDVTISKNCKNLGTVCPTGFDGTELCVEICDGRMCL